MKVGQNIPNTTVRNRVRDESIGGDNPFRWDLKHMHEYFAGKRVVVFSLPGAYTPTCSTMQVPGFESLAPEFFMRGVDEIYCISVNDAFVMNKWAQDQKLEHVQVIPDGNGVFTESMGQLVCKRHLGFGDRSWRYAMIVDNCKIVAFAEEPGKNNVGSDLDPYGETSPTNVLKMLTDVL
jgi:thioredoxin-dependent peroxiredoxin